ncbi:MAG: restriction endonuclease [Pyrinomonadaceae bacterium]
MDALDFDSMDETMLASLTEHYVDKVSEASMPLRQVMAAKLAEGGDDYCAFPVREACNRCGWWKQGIKFHNLSGESSSFAALIALDINDAEVAIREIRSHLARTFSDIYLLNPRRFEEVIATIYSDLGWKVVLTKQTRDGGIDLYCLSNSSGKICIVECKRYAKTRTVGISTLDRLIGVQVRTNADEAHLVTTSRFTQPALDAYEQAAARGIDLKLVDAHELFRLLNVYSNDKVTLPNIRRLFTDEPAPD